MLFGDGYKKLRRALEKILVLMVSTSERDFSHSKLMSLVCTLFLFISFFIGPFCNKNANVLIKREDRSDELVRPRMTIDLV